MVEARLVADVVMASAESASQAIYLLHIQETRNVGSKAAHRQKSQEE